MLLHDAEVARLEVAAPAMAALPNWPMPGRRTRLVLVLLAPGALLPLYRLAERRRIVFSGAPAYRELVFGLLPSGR